MKHLSRPLAYSCLVLLLLSICGLLVAAQELKKQSKDGHDLIHVTIQDYGIYIPIAANVSKADHKAVSDILQKYDKALYRLEMYQKGKLLKKSIEGSLNEMCIDKEV